MLMLRYLLLFATIVPVYASAQNMVQNGNFELKSPHPNKYDQSNECTGWRSYAGTPDFFYVGYPSWNTGVPKNFAGYCNPLDGKGYIGIVAYQQRQYREYIHTATTPLIPGTTYRVSMSVSRGDLSEFASNNIGVYFFRKGPEKVSSQKPFNVSPQVDYRNYDIITQTEQWVRVSASFVADSAYDHMIIGGFFPNDSVKVERFPDKPNDYAYYYIDSVVVLPITQIFNNN